MWFLVLPQPLTTGFEPAQSIVRVCPSPEAGRSCHGTDHRKVACEVPPRSPNEASEGAGKGAALPSKQHGHIFPGSFIKSLGRCGYFFLKLPRVLIIRHRVRLSSLKRYERAK